MAVLVNNLQEKVPVTDKLVKLVTDVVNIILEKEGYDKEAEVSLVFMDDSGIRELNRKYRRVDSPTDVLSFAMQEGPSMPGGEAEPVLGDVVISLETACRQAEEYGHGFDREVAYLTVHGVLHLLGYDHENEADKKSMREREEAVMRRVNLLR